MVCTKMCSIQNKHTGYLEPTSVSTSAKDFGKAYFEKDSVDKMDKIPEVTSPRTYLWISKKDIEYDRRSSLSG